ncbi:hypothetical protein [Synechococcus sp. LTW-R]|uniref:hypothetical protein n=1 Tax=Synechococcus sp. LTW-R TaxID=2751170 RepID=UPI001627BA63|nr:hypothetical protein [Synechococcus sp. LTW-R]QNG30454.1 hypothetical protein H0O22_04955 [Synechococcus sp. LTW-R]
MSRTTRLIKRLDKALADYKTFGSHPDAFVDELFAEIDDDVQVLLGKSKPSHWEEMYVERDRAVIKTLVLNRAMSMGASN